MEGQRGPRHSPQAPKRRSPAAEPLLVRPRQIYIKSTVGKSLLRMIPVYPQWMQKEECQGTGNDWQGQHTGSSVPEPT